MSHNHSPKIIKASLYCACTTTILIFVYIFAFTKEPPKIDFDLILGTAMVGGFMWFQSFVFCILLLLPLNHLFKRSSFMFSFLIFIIIGFTIPATGMYIMSTIPFHGETPALYKEDNFRFLIPILVVGVVGAIGAASAWYSLKRDTGINA